jgi:hypothetical protein
MKARSLLFALILLMAGHARGSSEFSLSMKDGSSFYVFFDGEIYEPTGSILSLFNLSSGLHTIDVYRFIRDPRGFNTKFAELVYRGSYRTDNDMRFETMVTIDGRLITTGKWTLAHKPGNGSHGGATGYNGHYGGVTGPGNSCSNGHGTGSNAMSPYEFGNLMGTIRSASFEQTKLTIAKDAIVRNSITADRVYQIMMLFSFESTKLEFAKWAYRYTDDKNNYYLVNRAFSFDSSKTELSKWISVNG